MHSVKLVYLQFDRAWSDSFLLQSTAHGSGWTVKWSWSMFFIIFYYIFTEGDRCSTCLKQIGIFINIDLGCFVTIYRSIILQLFVQSPMSSKERLYLLISVYLLLSNVFMSVFGKHILLRPFELLYCRACTLISKMGHKYPGSATGRWWNICGPKNNPLQYQ